MSADLCRRAAALMRQRANAASAAAAPPWFLHDCEGEVQVWPEVLCGVARDEDGNAVAWSRPGSWRPEQLVLEHDLDTWDRGEDEQDDAVRDTAEHVASWHPAVALAVADWLDDTASLLDGYDAEPPSNSTVGRGLAVARAYLGETS